MERPNKFVSYTDLRMYGWEISFLPLPDDGLYKVDSAAFNGRKMYKEDIETMLITLGIDLSGDNTFHIDRKHHRCLVYPQKVIQDYRFVGLERIDPEWIDSGYASQEVLGFSSQFTDLPDILKIMRRGGDRS